MCTLKIFVILLLALLVLGVLAFVFDSVKETESAILTTLLARTKLLVLVHSSLNLVWF